MADHRGRVWHHPDHARSLAQPRAETRDRYARRNRDEEFAPGRRLAPRLFKLGRDFGHHLLDSLRLDGEHDRVRFANDFGVVVGGGNLERSRQFAPAFGRDVGDDNVYGLEPLVLDDAVGERLGHVAAADESELLHNPRSPKTARPTRTIVAPSSIAI